MTILKPAALVLAAVLPATAFAQDVLDSNADGMVNLDEVQAVHPDVDADAFMLADADGDALLDANELAAAREAGLIPAEEG